MRGINDIGRRKEAERCSSRTHSYKATILQKIQEQQRKQHLSMTPILRTEMLLPSELQALFGEEKDYSCSLTDIVQSTESCAVSHLQRQVLSNQEYYTKLQGLKREHTRNIAELEKLYLNQLAPGQNERQLVSSREQVELTQVGSKVSAVLLKSGVSNLNLKSPQNSFEELKKSSCSQQKPFHNQVKDRTWDTSDSLRQNSKITVPKPFHMMLREEERKRRNMKTRSVMALENERLRRELDELKECGKKFRAKPAPVSTYTTFCDFNKRPNKHQNNPTDQGHHGNQRGTQYSAPPIPQKPFSFIEREQKKKEKKLADEINNLTAKEERKIFKARPGPKSLYRSSSPNYQMYKAESLNTIQRQNRRRSTLPPSILEDTLQEGENVDEEYPNEFSIWKWKTKGMLQVEEELERKRNRERDWSYIHPLRRASFSHSQELTHTCKSDYISV
ncbi:protein FAM161A-like isoform X2 [Triplophysa rosa]|uniref:protein FAM161A-like isoform X2 n=1 Tax=Triplophysa rosa TaxID=992332 RepID=UPI0025462C0B|nr:protein FAM161A-like isoform X2 [Triplophysa rosa]